MGRVSTWKVVGIVVLIGFPFAMEPLFSIGTGRGLPWFVLHQFYYAPVAWVGQPFFVPDSEVGFWVQPSGRVLTIILYLVLAAVAGRLWALWKRRADGRVC